MEKEQLIIAQEKKVEELHWEIQQWKSNFQFMDDELLFITRLLDGYIFEPNTPNIFERLENFKTRIKNARNHKKEARERISKHENSLGGMIECTDSACDLGYYSKHETLQSEVDKCLEDFQVLKTEIFNYAGGILKKRKP